MARRGVLAPKSPANQAQVRAEFLTGWKDIATFLGMGVRTVQRYEREMGLPIRRPGGKAAGPVWAVRDELEGWINWTTVRQRSRLKSLHLGDANRVGAQFLQTDSEIALTFSSLALSRAKGTERQVGAAKTARRAYDTIVRLRENLHLTKRQNERLDANLQRLRSELQSLGQSF